MGAQPRGANLLAVVSLDNGLHMLCWAFTLAITGNWDLAPKKGKELLAYKDNKAGNSNECGNASKNGVEHSVHM